MQGSLLLSNVKLHARKAAQDSNSPPSRDFSIQGANVTSSPGLGLHDDNYRDSGFASDAFKELSQQALTTATGTQADVLSLAMKRMQPNNAVDTFLGARLNLHKNFLLRPSESLSQRKKQNMVGKSILTRRAHDARQRLEFIERLTRRA